MTPWEVIGVLIANVIQNPYLHRWCYWYDIGSGLYRGLWISIEFISGYIGGSVLERLLGHPKRETFVITALVRSVDKAKALNTLGVNTVVASLSDLDKLTEHASASNVVINTVF